MPYVKNDFYTLMPFHCGIRRAEFYEYYTLRDLANKSGTDKKSVFRCRTIGVLQSINGKFYLSDLDVPASKAEPLIRISLVYLTEPPPSTIIPYAAQVFGTVQWKNRPVIFAKLLQPYNTAMAMRLKSAMQSIVTTHSAKHQDLNDTEE